MSRERISSCSGFGCGAATHSLAQPADLRVGADGGRLGRSHGCPTVSASKRPSTSSLRRFITSRPYVTIAELRRRFGLDDPDAMAHLARNGTSAWVGLPEREATKLQDLWERDEIGVELSVEVRAPVVVGVYPMRIARYVMDGVNGAPPAVNHRPALPPVSPARPAVDGTGPNGTRAVNGTNGVEPRQASGGFQRRHWPSQPMSADAGAPMSPSDQRSAGPGTGPGLQRH